MPDALSNAALMCWENVIEVPCLRSPGRAIVVPCLKFGRVHCELARECVPQHSLRIESMALPSMYLGRPLLLLSRKHPQSFHRGSALR